MKDIKTFIKMIKQLNYIMSPRQRRQIFFIFLGNVGYSIFELLGITIIFPFIQLILEQEKIMERQYLSFFIHFFGIDTYQGVILFMGCAIMGVYLIKNIYQITVSCIQIKFETNFKMQLSVKRLQEYMKRPYIFFVNTNSSEIIRDVSNDVHAAYSVISELISLIREGVTILLITAFLFYADALMSGLILCLGGIVFLIFVFGLKSRIGKAGEQRREAIAADNKALYEAVNGIKEIKVMNRSSYFVNEYIRSEKRLKETQDKVSIINCLPERVIELLCVGVIIGCILIRLIMGVDIGIFIPSLAAFAVAAFRIMPSIARIIARVNQLIFFRSALQSTYDAAVLNEKYRREESQYMRSHADCEKRADTMIFEKAVSIKSILWKYESTKTGVLDNLDLEIEKGESIALIGESGSGKTTLANCILGLLQPQDGEIRMDGIDIYTIPDRWAEIIGYVPQNIFLMDDTIRQNIIFGAEEAKEEKIWAALERAQLKDFVENLPNKLDTMVGERGVKFSGGQRQRLAIARALFSDPDILVLDEATAALDNETESAVMEAIDVLRGEKTLIIVAHRLSTIKNCDKIYEIKNGRAIACEKDKVLKGV